jgi:hypothetical protein
LVIHEGQQRIDDKAGSGSEKGGKLEAKALAEARGEKDHLPHRLLAFGPVQNSGDRHPLKRKQILDPEALFC